MADRFCGNCGSELRPDNKFCPNCGRPVHETSVLATPEADVDLPPPQQIEEATAPPRPKQDAAPPTSPASAAGTSRRLSTTVKAFLVVAAFVGVVAVANQSGTGVLLAVVVLLLAGVAYLSQEEGSGPAETLTEPVSAEPISELERTRRLDAAINEYLGRRYSVQFRTSTTAQLVRPKKFSAGWAILWLLVFIVGLFVYILYYLGKRDERVYLQVDEFGSVRATRQRG
jgi:hypothetical protein